MVNRTLFNKQYKTLYTLFLVVFCGFKIGDVDGITIKKVCPADEAHKSCAFYEEYVCWVTENRYYRVKASAKRLAHCKSGCFCKKGYVRDYPGGGCILAAGCQNHVVGDMLEKLALSIDRQSDSTGLRAQQRNNEKKKNLHNQFTTDEN